ncbi:MAG: S8 family serine peptidase, partial [Ekhidna sp.]|nr:S8 family serine peptidase [Ekhidna sp.]
MKNLYALILCFFLFSIQAQDYYYNGSKKVKIYESKNSFISYDKPTQAFSRGFEQAKTFSAKGFTILGEEKNDASAKKFRSEQLTQTTSACLLSSNGDFKMYPTKTVRVKLKDGKTKEDVLKLFTTGEILKTEDKYGILRLSVKHLDKILEIANKIYEAGIAEFSVPDFYIPIKLNQVKDPLFPLQFQMHNTGQVIDGVAGVNDIDVNALEAWNINLGDNITVAVIDQGMENHEDFGNRFIGGFTPATNGNGTPISNNATHGMNCAGIVGASHNNLGIRGVAPKVKFLSVNIFANGTTAGDVADGIRWAVDNGADVLSNSWGFIHVPCNYTDPDIDDAIQYAITKGRNKKGAVVVFASGNEGGCISYPATNNNVIAVGAVDHRGNLFDYSARGPELDLVAPSGKINGSGNVRTTDRMGNAGILTGNYDPHFGGTSASCPLVSGIASLVLSVNPNLTQREVRKILTNTATDMGSNGFDNNFGHGRANAYAAVQEAQLSKAELESVDVVRYNESKTINLKNHPYYKPVAWIVSSNVEIVSKNNSQITIRSKAFAYYNTSRLGWVKARLSNGKVLREAFIREARPVIRFADTSLTQALLNPNANTTVNYSAVTVRDGDRIRFTVEGASSVQWKNTRRASYYPSYSARYTGYGERHSSIRYVPVPYSGCYGSSGSPPNSLPSAQASRLLDYYFIQSGDWQAPGYSPPIQLLSGSGDVLEVELTARNACGCTTAVNHYKVNVARPSGGSSGGHSLTVSPNPARTNIKIQVKAPPFQSPVRRDNLASLEACCRKFNSDKRYGRYYSP